MPLVGVGLIYMKGYFDQRLRVDGWQEDSDDEYDISRSRRSSRSSAPGQPYLATVETSGRPVHVRAWRMTVGRVPIYLLDTNLEVNHPDDRGLMNKLYAGGPDLRVRQEWILGVGGVRVLRALGIDPAVWHANEGHAAFMMIERLREHLPAGMPFEDAVAAGARAQRVHHPHAGARGARRLHGRVSWPPAPDRSGRRWASEGAVLRASAPLDRGAVPHDRLALRLSARVNGVSRRHGQVSRTLWRDLWPGRPWEAVPIGHVTNGVHLATWMATPIMRCWTSTSAATGASGSTSRASGTRC